MSERPPYRLPHHVVPRRYQLEIEPDLFQARFDGQVVVEVEVREPITEIVINALELVLHEARLTSPEGRELTGVITYNSEEEQVILSWPEVLQPGEWTLSIRYSGILGTTMSGFYRTSVQGRDGKDVIIAATQCEQTDARRVFPGWDEPEFKAKFAITLVVDTDLAAFSNGQEVFNIPDDDRGKKRITFAETIPMSSYLVALVVGPYETSDPQMVGNVPIRVAARPGFRHLTNFALSSAVGALTYFEQYFGMAYPGDKLDHMAIPEFAAGAMENLGCVTYREELLLLDPARSSPNEQINVVSTIAHETAHMWFGDLVTMRWWNGIWLNEAFATFMQVHATEALHPEWDPWTTFSQERSMAMTVDALQNSRPIEYPVGRPVESWAMFDLLTYQKGASVLRMLEQYLGEETFRSSIVHYLNQHRYGNTETNDLWDALETVSSQPVRAIMDSWVLQAGYPLVRAELSGDGHELKLSQKQFRYGPPGPGQWQVPVTVGIGLQDGSIVTERRVLGDEPVTIPLAEKMAWVVVNRGGWGFYRVAYDESLSTRISAALPAMTAIERYQMLDDVWAAVVAGDVPLTHAVKRWRAIVEERDPDVWGAVTAPLFVLADLADETERKLLAQLVREIARPLFEKLGWDPDPGEDVRQARIRALLLRLLGTIGQDVEVVEEVRRRWHDHLDGVAVLSPELLTPMVHVVANSGDEKDWELMRQESKKATTPQDEQRYLYGLGRFSRPDLLKRTLDLYLSDEVRVQDGTILLGLLVGNRHASRMTWEAIESHWAALLARYPARTFEHMVFPVARMMDEDLADRAAQWLTEHPIEELERPIKQALEIQGINRALKHRIQGRLAEYLS